VCFLVFDAAASLKGLIEEIDAIKLEEEACRPLKGATRFAAQLRLKHRRARLAMVMLLSAPYGILWLAVW